MSLKVDRVELEIVIKNDENRKKLREIEDSMRSVQKELKKAKQGTEEYANAEARLKNLKLAHDEIYNKIGLTNLSLKELNRRQQELRAILTQVPGNSPLYAKYKEQLDQVNARMRELRGGAQTTSFSIGKLADVFNRYFALATAFAASLTGVVMGFRALKEERDKLEDSKANLKALTGLGQEDVDKLTEWAKQMSFKELEGTGIRIRSSAQEIVDAYTKVGSQKPELLKNAEALNEVTKQSLILATASKMEVVPAADGLTNMMNQYGASAKEAAHYMNVLAAGSQAGAKEVPYISESMTKFGSVAKLANVSVEQSVALIETLGEKGHAAEIAGTGLKTFFVKLMNGADETNPRIVGMHTALDNLAKKFSGDGGFSRMVKTFGQDNVVIAQTVIEQRKRFEELTAAVTGTRTGLEQAAINSKTPAAIMAQNINKMKIAGVELVDKLQPAMSLLTGWFSKTVQALPAVVDWFDKWGGVIVKTTIVIGAYTVAIQLQTFWQKRHLEASLLDIATTKLKIFWDTAATAAVALQAAAIFLLNGNLRMAIQTMRIFFITIGLNPIALLTAGVAAAIVVVWTLTNRTKELTLAQQSQLSIQKKVEDGMAEHVGKIEYLTAAIHNEKLALDKRRAAIEQLRKIIPGYNAVISDEGRIIMENTRALDEYLKAMEREIRMKATQEEYTELIKQQMKLEKEVLSARKKMLESTDDHEQKVYSVLVNSLQEKLNEVKAAKAALSQDIGKNLEPAKTNASANLSKEDKVLWNETYKQYLERKALIQKEYAEKKAVFGLTAAKMFDLQKEENNRLLALNAEYVAKQKKIGKKEHSNSGKANDSSEIGTGGGDDSSENAKTKRLKSLLEQQDNLHKSFIAKSNDEYRDGAKDKETIERMNMEQIEAYQKQREKDKTAMEDKILADEIETLKKKKDITAKAGKDTSELSAQIAQKEAEQMDRIIKSRDKYWKDLQEVDKKALEDKLSIIQDNEDKELIQLEKDRALGLESEVSYNDKRLAILKKYANERVELSGLSPTQKAAMQKQIAELTIDEINNNSKDHQNYIDKYGTQKEKLILWKEKEQQILEAYALKENLSAEKKAQIQEVLDKEYTKRKLARYSDAAQAIADIAGNLSSAAQGLQQSEEMAVERKYKKLIKAAGSNQKQVTKLEEQKEKELAMVRRKWADKQFILSAAQIVATTAVAAMNSFASMSLFGGPIVGAIAAAAAVAAGAAQLAVANQARQQAKEGLYAGGYSNDYAEGYTKKGRSRDEAGVIPVHGNEFVGNNEGVANPHVRQFYDIFNNAQRNGRIRMMNTSEILQNIKLQGLYSGGYSNSDNRSANSMTSNSPGNVSDVSMADLSQLSNILSRLDQKMDTPFKGVVAITGTGGLKEQQALYDKMIANKSRS